MKRSNNRGKRQSNPSSRHYDSNASNVKVRGTPIAVFDKYQSLARDAATAGDQINAENYLQHAEHYLRLAAESQPVKNAEGHQPVKNNDVDRHDSAKDNTKQENDPHKNAKMDQDNAKIDQESNVNND